MYKPEILMVFPLDKDAIIKHISVFVPPKNNQEYYIETVALFRDEIIVDTECCYYILEKKHVDYFVDFVHDIPVRIKTKTKSGHSMSMTTDFYFPINVDYLKSTFCMPQTSLKDFMGTRYGYNPRIEKNTREFIRDMNNYYKEDNKLAKPETSQGE